MSRKRKNNEIEELEEKLFGSNEPITELLQENREESLGFYIDVGGDDVDSHWDTIHSHGDHRDSTGQANGGTIGEQRETRLNALGESESEDERPVWEDDDEIDSIDIQTKSRTRKLKATFDEKSINSKQYENRLRSQFQSLNPTPEWAKVREDLNLFQSTARLVVKKAVLDESKLKVSRVKDANHSDYSKSTIQSLQFHPNAPVVLTAGLDKTLRLFHVNGKENPKIKSYFIKDLPIYSANFTTDGSEVILTGRRNYFYYLDLKSESVHRINRIRGRDENSLEQSFVSPDGRFIIILGVDGYVLIISTQTKQLLGTVRMNSTAVSVAFSPGFLWTLSRDGQVYQWELETRECIHTFTDHGNIKATTIAISPNSIYMAVGSTSGVVNLYTLESLGGNEHPLPLKAFMNLTTAATSIVFHPSSDLLAIASNDLKDSLRIVNVLTKTVIQNWPTDKTPLGYVSSVAFSGNGQYISIGNDKGKVLLYCLEAFQ